MAGRYRILAAIAGAGLTGWAAAADLAAPESKPEKGIWGAIAYSSPDARHGFFWGADTRKEAAEQALRHCENAGGKACATVIEFRNHRHWDDDDETGFPYHHCAALAVGAEGADGIRSWGVAAAEKRSQAENLARQQCGGEEKACTIREWVCT
jgi:hypothetical protein